MTYISDCCNYRPDTRYIVQRTKMGMFGVCDRCKEHCEFSQSDEDDFPKREPEPENQD